MIYPLRSLIILFFLALISISCEPASEGQGERVRKKVFRYNQAGGISSLDPAFARNQANIWAISQIYNGLFQFGKGLNPDPVIADSWSISDDQLVYEIDIRRNIFFQDNPCFEEGVGREVTAHDVVYSFKRLVSDDLKSPGAWVFTNIAKKDKNGKLASDWISARGDFRVIIRLDAPYGALLERLAMPFAYIVAHEAVEYYGDDFRKNPVGSGPFVFEVWDENAALVLLKNNNYWKKDDRGRSLPYIDAIQVSFISDRMQEFRTFKKGEIDMMSGVSTDWVDIVLNKAGEVRKEIAGQFTVLKTPYMNTEYIGFQLDPKQYDNPNHPFLDQNFRSALNYAVNKDELVAFLFNNVGEAGVNGFVPPYLYSQVVEPVKGIAFDREMAANLLEKSVYNGEKIQLYTTQFSKALVEFLQKQWANIGVEVEIINNSVSIHQQLVDEGKALFFRGSWLGDFPDPETYLSFFYGSNIKFSGPNKTHYRSGEFDDLYKKAKKEGDTFTRFDMYREMDQMVTDESAVIVLFYDEVVRLLQPNIVGMDPNPMNLIQLEKVDIIPGKLRSDS
ncbi:MAG: ABC transporter substrate-binding protein [Cyclobacteriaceae bacterium]|nr:ABC transporter substrate-binding protein [Cyclobacteriaceae bacterium]MCH8516635.1 ABC transporter substrate-binding protein [Cyclobacteriaceae bacterium]